jgi:hypothetical protein
MHSDGCQELSQRVAGAANQDASVQVFQRINTFQDYQTKIYNVASKGAVEC